MNPFRISETRRQAGRAAWLAGVVGLTLTAVAAPAQATNEEPVPTRHIAFKQAGDVTLRLHVFEPAGLESTDRRPAIIFFFGGGWVGGTPSQFYAHCAHLAERGWVAMSAEYRVRSRHGTSPDECVQDGKSALRWVRKHARELGVDPHRIAAGGGSAGGHVAAATGTLKGFDEPGEDTAVSARPDALVLFNPVFDNGPDGYGHDRVKERWEEFSPLHNIGSGVPPAVVFLGTKDRLIPVATAEAFQRRMEQVGSRCELHLYEGQGHGFFNHGRGDNLWYDATVAAMDAFLGSLEWAVPPGTGVRPSLEAGWEVPPDEAKLRAYWWWLNGNVSKAAITRDLEAMKRMGWGGALICDADGSSQDGNDRAPHGPDFLSDEWRELYRFALHEADRLGLELSLNIQSGWNLGGPMVPPEDAPKQLVWTSRTVEGPTAFEAKLTRPQARDGFYRDLFVLAVPLASGSQVNPRFEALRGSSAQSAHPVNLAGDGNPDTFWVSATDTSDAGPSPERSQWLELVFREPISATHLTLQPRALYGPRAGFVEARDDVGTFRRIGSFKTRDSTSSIEVPLDGARGRVFRVVFTDAFDPRFPAAPRNVQVAEVTLSGARGDAPVAVSRRSLLNLEQKALRRGLHFSAPDTMPLLEQAPATPGEADASADEVLDLTANLAEDGILRCELPEGRWQILRLGWTLNDHCRVSTCSEGWEGYAVDPFDAGAFTRYWDAVVEPLIADAGPLAGSTLKYLHTDSWEVEVANWTPTLREEFKQRRGYDPLPWLPVITGRIIGSRDASNRFLHDLRRTMGDLAIDHHYRLFKERAHAHGLLIHPESGGPHAVPIDAQQCLTFNDAPMSEFWAWSWRHRIGDANRFFVKQPASAAHAGGHRFVLAEGFTTIGPHWQETLWDNLKPAFDHACCEGLNRLVWHEFVCSPEEMGRPGQQYFAGTHVNPNVTWWGAGRPFFDYLNRCQWMLQQGRFVADVAYYYGDHVPNFAQYKATDPAGALPGHDYDVLSADVILDRLRVEDGRLVLPDGMSYRMLVLPDREAISLPVLEKVNQLVAEGAVVVGRKPSRATGMRSPREDDERVQQLAAELWGGEVEDGKVFAAQPAREVLADLGVLPDFTGVPADAASAGLTLNHIHRRLDETDIYFVANRTNRTARFDCTFRVADKAPELWNPVTGERRFAAAYESTDGRTTVPLEFAPCGSWFVVFREPAKAHPATATENRLVVDVIAELSGPWPVHFPYGMSLDEFSSVWDLANSKSRTVVFDSLDSWTSRPEPGIKFYSGGATYTNHFELPESGSFPGDQRILLDLGEVRELASVTVNGRAFDAVWTPPFRVDITDAVKPGSNSLAVYVLNFWPNRLIGDSALPVKQRRTRTNIRKFTPDTPLMRSGLFGPVRVLTLTPPATTVEAEQGSNHSLGPSG